MHENSPKIPPSTIASTFKPSILPKNTPSTHHIPVDHPMGATLSQLFRRPRHDPFLPPPPSRPAVHQSDRLVNLQGISKNQQKKLRREKRLQERKQARKEARRSHQAQQKAQRKAEREAYWQSLPLQERQRVQRERLETMRAGRAEERERRSHIRDVLQHHTRYAFCVDLGWNDKMYDKERKSLARQLAYSYNALRKCAESGNTPLAMSITGIDSVIKPVLTFAAQGWETWPVQLSEKSLTQFHDKRKLVYLTHDADDVLHHLDPHAVYVIGGIVDRNRLVGATAHKARSLGIRTLRLNLDANITLQHGTCVLTVNHCVEILVHAANGLSWREAYLKVLPPRKGIQPSAAHQP